MLTIDRSATTLAVVDFQTKLMPAIDDGAAVMANARRLIDAAAMLSIPTVFTEQNPGGLGATVVELSADPARTVHKMTFDACQEPAFLDLLGDRTAVVVAGCEAHVCVLQTVLGLIVEGRKVFLVRDALGARRGESKETAIKRMAHHGAEIVTTEMVILEWLKTAEHPMFRDILSLVK